MADHLTPDPIPPDDDRDALGAGPGAGAEDPDADRSDEQLGEDPGERGVPGGREADAGDDS